MKGVVVAEFLTLALLVGVLYVIWLHDEQLKQLEEDYFNLREDMKPKPRPSRAKAATDGKVDE